MAGNEAVCFTVSVFKLKIIISDIKNLKEAVTSKCKCKTCKFVCGRSSLKLNHALVIISEHLILEIFVLYLCYGEGHEASLQPEGHFSDM